MIRAMVKILPLNSQPNTQIFRVLSILFVHRFLSVWLLRPRLLVALIQKLLLSLLVLLAMLFRLLLLVLFLYLDLINSVFDKSQHHRHQDQPVLILNVSQISHLFTSSRMLDAPPLKYYLHFQLFQVQNSKEIFTTQLIYDLRGSHKYGQSRAYSCLSMVYLNNIVIIGLLLPQYQALSQFYLKVSTF